MGMFGTAWEYVCLLFTGTLLIKGIVD